MPTNYESEQSLTREETARALREMADGIASGSLLIGDGEEAFSVSVPDSVAFELEVESEDGTRSVEAEIEWPERTEPGQSKTEQAEPAQTETEQTEPEQTDSERTEPEPVETESLPVNAAGLPRSLARFELFRDRGDGWRWRLVHRNGNVIATSGEGYTRKHNAEKGLWSVMQNAPTAETVEDTDR